MTKLLPFPYLKYMYDLASFIEDKPTIRFLNASHGTMVCCYMISGPDTFDNMYAREARGTTFDRNNRIAGRPLHKFFNLNEKPSTLVSELKDKKITRLMDKRDGSMIHTVNIDGQVYFKSKKSFESDVAKAATEWITRPENAGYMQLSEYCAQSDQTAIFEWTSPTARIVLAYPEDGLQLLHIRNNLTGEYQDLAHLKILAHNWKVKLVDSYTATSLAELLKIAETIEGIEGWIAQFEDGNMVKIKTKWYMDRHHAMTFLRERDVAKMVIDESIDDLKAKLVSDGLDISKILHIEHLVINTIENMVNEVKREYECVKDLERKAVAEKLNGHVYFKMIMDLYSGKVPRYAHYFEKYYLSNFSLTQIQMVDTVAEAEDE